MKDYMSEEKILSDECREQEYIVATNIAKFIEKIALCQLPERWKWQEWCFCSKDVEQKKIKDCQL